MNDKMFKEESKRIMDTVQRDFLDSKESVTNGVEAQLFNLTDAVLLLAKVIQEKPMWR